MINSVLNAKLSPGSRRLRGTSISALLMLATGLVSGCEAVSDGVYGERGVKAQVQPHQEFSLRKVDLVLLLDPSEKRVKGGPNNEIDRAIDVFDEPENNDNTKAGLPANCSPTGRDETLVGRTVGFIRTTTTVATEEVSVTIDEKGRKKSERKKPRGKPVVSVDVDFSKGPKIEPAKLCLRQRRMKERRNEIVHRLLNASDASCSRYLNTLAQFESDLSFASNLLSAGAGVAGAIVSGGASQILSAVSGGASSIAAGVSDSYFNGRSIAAVETAIRARRLTLETELKTRLVQAPAQFPITEALKLVDRYHYACSLREGLDQVNKATEEQLSKAQLKAEAVKENTVAGGS